MSSSSGSSHPEVSFSAGPVDSNLQEWQATVGLPREANEGGSNASPTAVNPSLTPSATLPDWFVSASPTVHSVIVDVVSVFRNVDASARIPSDSSLPAEPASSEESTSSQRVLVAGAPAPTGSSNPSEEESEEGQESPQSEGQGTKEADTEATNTKAADTKEANTGEADTKEADTKDDSTQSKGEDKTTPSSSSKDLKSGSKEGKEEEDQKSNSPSRESSEASEEAAERSIGFLVPLSLQSESSSFPMSTEEPTGLVTDSTPLLGPQDLGPSTASSSISEPPTPSDVDSQTQEASSGSSSARYVILGVCLFVAVLFGAIILLIMKARKRRHRERYPSVSQLEKSEFTTIPDRGRVSRYTENSDFPRYVESPTGRESRRTSTSSSISRISNLAIVVPNPEMSSEALPLAAQLTPTAPLNFTPRRTSNPFDTPTDTTFEPRPSTPTDSMYSQTSAGTTMHNVLNSRSKAPDTLMQLVGIAAPGSS